MAAWGDNMTNASHAMDAISYRLMISWLINYIYKLLLFNSRELQDHKISIYDNIYKHIYIYIYISIYLLINSTVLILQANNTTVLILHDLFFFCFLFRHDYTGQPILIYINVIIISDFECSKMLYLVVRNNTSEHNVEK